MVLLKKKQKANQQAIGNKYHHIVLLYTQPQVESKINQEYEISHRPRNKCLPFHFFSF